MIQRDPDTRLRLENTARQPNPAAPEYMFWLGHNPGRWAMLHQAVDASGNPIPARRAVVFCPPFAEEEKCSRRLYVDLARSLAPRGVASLRLAYAGTGDSQGEFSDFSLEGAVADVTDALTWLRDTLQPAALAVFGLRLGGSLALQAAGAEPGVDRVALWAPVTNGRSYVRMNFRRKAIRQMINTGATQGQEAVKATPDTGSDPDPAGIFDFDGYPVARTLWDEMERLRLAPQAGWAGQCLVVSVGPADRPTPDCVALANSLTEAASQVELRNVVAQPFWNLLGLVECPEIVEMTANWLAR